MVYLGVVLYVLNSMFLVFSIASFKSTKQYIYVLYIFLYLGTIILVLSQFFEGSIVEGLVMLIIGVPSSFVKNIVPSRIEQNRSIIRYIVYLNLAVFIMYFVII
ncbi:hypothetical protein CI105_05850 [Candidatus Izimaplasma bacterium ZiA1]|uniref:hypothetical protein n=1 Tax=Candidatus Izimoplasma sp. ZiA1 TaxID=2024899 RepID=UPI000BAA43C5|nr:hypothetical protein CI105_05850 [Candidatus Izimaplasma bacterium ZiA1]